MTVVELVNYRGKIAILDFWATPCRGCEEEPPWFSRLQWNNRSRGLSVIAGPDKNRSVPFGRPPTRALNAESY